MAISKMTTSRITTSSPTSAGKSPIILLDGGMGRELLRMGAPFRQPEWSALALMQAPEIVKRAHEAFAGAGSHILTTSNYAVVPFHIGEVRFSAEGEKLTDLAGRLAREVADGHDCRVAGCLPPPFGSYRPDLFDLERAPALLKVITAALSRHVDIWLAETLSSIAEAKALAKAIVAHEKRPLWMAFTLLDGEDSAECRLRSGETVSSAVDAAIELGASAILFNCSQPEVMAPAIETAVRTRDRLAAKLEVGAYANAFPSQHEEALANADLHDIREDIDPEGYLVFARQWRELGANIIGGCCGIGPEHIATLHEKLK